MVGDFIHLRTHTQYSLAEGAIKIDDLIDLTVKNNMPAVAITDSGNLFGSLEFSKACTKKNIKPIIGCVFKFGLVLYAENEIGYKNLLKLSSKSFLESVDIDNIAGYTDGLIALTGGTYGIIGQLLLASKDKEAEENLLRLARLFPKSLYIELTRLGYKEEDKIEEKLIDLAYKHNIPIVATNDIYFANKEMHEAHDALLCIADGRYVSEGNRRKVTAEHYFKSAEQMKELFADLPEAIENTVIIANRCKVKSEERAPMLPRFQTESGKDEAKELYEQALQGLTMRLETQVFIPEMTAEEKAALTVTYKDRLLFELNVINGMKFPGYFLIVSDFIKWAKSQNIPVGPGRGSGAGSLVAWSLEITDLNPIRFGLLFERFLNPERVSMPDFDIDFCQERRDEVIKYVQQKYGEDKVAQIITFGKLQARAVVRDVGRVLQIPYGQVDRISKMIPNNPAHPVSLAEAVELEPALKQAINEDNYVEHLIKIALQLEGLNRHASTHAAGVVIADRAISDIVPLYKDDKSDMPVVQYSMKYAEAAGLVKFDFLGLKTLTVLSHACKLIDDNIDLLKIPLDDKKTYEMLSKGNSVGVFQFESAGMRDALRKLKPDCIEDLIALGALYRPGPMDNIPEYIACKHGYKQPDYLHPSLEPILKETFGVIIYQEQVMQIAQVLSGYSLGGADLLRRAMGKKIQTEMDAQRELFVNGAVANGVDSKQASNIFNLVDKFAGYGFNKSHAAAYALISYQTAYIKANYPVEFIVASMNLDIDDTDKLSVFRDEARYMGIEILPPDINKSDALFCIENGCIRYAIGALKNVGVESVRGIVSERRNGLYKDVFDFVARNNVNKRNFISMAKAGVFGGNRKQLIESIIFIFAHKAKNNKQVSLFNETPALDEIEDYSFAERANNEFSAIGFYLKDHPLDRYQVNLQKMGIVSSDLINRDGYRAKVAGIIIDINIKISAYGRYAYAKISEAEGSFEVIVYEEKIIDKGREFLKQKTPVIFDVIRKNNRIIANEIYPLKEVIKKVRVCASIGDVKIAIPGKYYLDEFEGINQVEEL